MGKLKGGITKAKFRYWVKEPKKRKRPVSLFCKPFGPALKPNANSHIVTGGSMGGDLTATSPKIRSTSNVTSSFGDLQKTSEHQKKKKKKPKRLNDLERKDRDTEVLGHNASGLLLQNIHNSDTMAVVGATIISQMKKCAQNEQTSSSTPSSSRVNLDIDTDVTKSNQESIVQLTLESLLQSDHLSAARHQLEFSKELEELLDFHEPAQTEDTDGKNQQ